LDPAYPYIVRFAMWLFYTWSLTMFAAAIGEYVSRDSEGSGIPEMKTILGGVNIYKYLSFQTMIGKMLNVSAVQAAGLAVGKLGPYIHITCCLCNQMCKLRWFNDIKNNHSLKKQMLV